MSMSVQRKEMKRNLTKPPSTGSSASPPVYASMSPDIRLYIFLSFFSTWKTVFECRISILCRLCWVQTYIWLFLRRKEMTKQKSTELRNKNACRPKIFVLRWRKSVIEYCQPPHIKYFSMAFNLVCHKPKGSYPNSSHESQQAYHSSFLWDSTWRQDTS